MNTVNQEVTDLLLNKGASLAGFADITEIPAACRYNLNYGIIIAKALNPEIVALMGDRPVIEYSEEYHKANELLTELALGTAAFLMKGGYKARAVTRDNFIFNKNTRSATIPYKTIATRTGIGWIGKNALLITEQYGAAVRFAAVLTNAVLDVGTPIDASLCNDCTECVDICPGKAISGILWEKGIKREKLLTYDKCNETIKKRGKIINTRHGSCGMCIAACPWTKQYLQKANKKK